ncbi:MAG: Ig-like domain repeat protein [Armatimonadetes bacterium]|nr:Ig-like domain repeat protein [Armatimonadota bacterium]
MGTPRGPLLLAALAAAYLLPQAHADGAPSFKTRVFTRDGVAVVGYAPQTRLRVTTYGSKQVWSGWLPNTRVTRLALKPGNYTLEAGDEFKVISVDLAAYDRGTAPPAKPATRPSAVSRVPFVLTVVPVPWVADATFADNPPSFASSHVVFNGVATRLKAVIKGGVAPYTVAWNTGDGSVTAPYQTSDPVSGAALLHTYTGLSVNTQIAAGVTVTDALGATGSAPYFVVVGDPSVRSNRANRAADEGLWYLHSMLVRRDGSSYDGQPAADDAFVPYLYNGPDSTYASVAGSSMAAIAFENTGRSISGGKNYSSDGSKDAYVEDLDLLINYLTRSDNLTKVNVSGSVITFASGRTLNPDTHGPGGTPNGFVAKSPSGTYEAGPQLQALCQAGYVMKAIPNRSDYATYYDLIGDVVDAFQWSQGYSGYAEGGWRYDLAFNYNDSDGSTAAWAFIGLRAAEQAHTFTPGPRALYPPAIEVSAVTKAEAAIWLTNDQVANTATDTFGIPDYRQPGTPTIQTQYAGGLGYTTGLEGPNAAKTAGGLAGLKFIGAANDSAGVKGAISFLYRNFFNPDSLWGWSSARDAYGMYNVFKGLREAEVNVLTDPLGTGGNSLDGRPLQPFDWYNTLVDWIAGASASDLGHQNWHGTTAAGTTYFSPVPDGHFEPSGYQTTDWPAGASDQNAQVGLVTGWDIAILAGAVFTPSPVAVIGHPDGNNGETYVPLQSNGQDHYVTFDPVGSYEQNPSARIVRVRWEFGDGAVDEYNLPTPSSLGGVVPSAPGIHPAGNQTRHHYAAERDFTVTLTVYDDAGNSGVATVVVHVIPPPFPPVGLLDIEPANGSKQLDDTFGVLPDGTLTLRIKADRSFNPRPDVVGSPADARGISAFAFEWPANPDTGFNNGRSEVPASFDQGADAALGTYNLGSKDPVQTYTFRFDPAALPNAMSIGIRVKSNIASVNGVPPDTVTVLRQIRLRRNADLRAPSQTVGEAVTGARGETVSLKATVTSAGAPLAGKTVQFTVQGEAGAVTAPTGANGAAAAPFTVPLAKPIGDFIITPSFAGDADYAPSAGSGTLTVTNDEVNVQTAITVPNVRQIYGRSTDLTARLVRVRNGQAVSGKTIVFTVGGWPAGSAVTGADGWATITYQAPRAWGLRDNRIVATFAGDAKFLASSGAGTLTVAAATGNTKLVVRDAQGRLGQSVNLLAFLNVNRTNTPIRSRTIVYQVDYVQIGSAVTNVWGSATLAYTIPSRTPTGIRPVTCIFAGEGIYDAAVGYGKLTVSP